MRVLYAVQRYGPGVAGGAEAACRMYAEQLAARGHHVEVVTSCALSYTDWADHFAPGTETIGGVTVHRLPVTKPRDAARFDALSIRITAHGRSPLHLQRLWLDEQGPTLRDYRRWMRTNASRFDVVAFYPYLYQTTTDGLPAAATQAPTLLHAAAHDEWPLHLPVYDTIVRQADGMFFHTPEEQQLVHDRFHARIAVEDTPGIGVDDAPTDVDVAAFRRTFGLGDRPYLLVLGRVDPSKGTHEAVQYFEAYKRRHGGDLALVVMGDVIHDVGGDADVVCTGFVDEAAKHAALAGAEVLVQPSYLESFSIALLEAFQHRTPALVQRACAVLDGQVRRSGGGLAYRGFAEFEAALELLLTSERLRHAMGEAGRDFVRGTYRWPVVIERYERLLEATVDAGARRLGRLDRPGAATTGGGAPRA